MFVDNKDYKQAVHESHQTTFILYDVRSTTKFKVNIFRKTDNGVALCEILAMNGVHKLPYSCLVHSDGCGSMQHVEVIAVTMGLHHAYIPLHAQRLNEAEKICLVTWDNAAAIMLQAEGISNHLFNEAVSYALYVDMCMSTAASHGFKTLLEIICGVVPDITKLHQFYTCSFVCIPRQKCKQLAGKGFIGWAEVRQLMGFCSPFLSTFKVLLSKNCMVHSSNVTFDDSNCTNKCALPSLSMQVMDINIGTSGIPEEENLGYSQAPHQSSTQSLLQPHSPSQSSQHSTS